MKCAAAGLDGPLAEGQPRPGRVDRLAVDGHPCGHLLEHLFDFGIERAVGPLHDIEQQVAVLADDVDEHVDRPVDIAELPVLVVVPVADGGVGLPG